MNKLLYIISLILILSSCTHKQEKLIKFTGETQGTYYAVTYLDKENRNLQTEIDTLLSNFDQSASMWVENSIISKVNRNEPGLEVDEIFIILFKMSQEVYQNSDGAFDPTIGPLVNASRSTCCG